MRNTRFLAVLAILALVFAVGCSQQRANTASVKDTVETSFEQAKLENINIDEDREHKVLTLKGEVESAAMKQRAEELAKNSAAGWTIANEIGVRPEGDNRADDRAENRDDRLKEQIQTAWKENEAMKDVDVRVENGVVTLTGEVQNESSRKAAEAAVKAMPGVEQVVNKIEMEAAKKRY